MPFLFAPDPDARFLICDGLLDTLDNLTNIRAHENITFEKDDFDTAF